jgi:transposase
LRRLLVIGVTSVIQQVERRRKANKTSRSASPWLLQLLARKPQKRAAIALAYKACPGAGRGWPAPSGPCW